MGFAGATLLAAPLAGCSKEADKSIAANAAAPIRLSPATKTLPGAAQP